MIDRYKTNSICNEIIESYAKARDKHAPMHSPHEGAAIIQEEFEELWDMVKAWNPAPKPNPHEPEQTATYYIALGKYHANMQDMRKEALHVAAMALAFLIEVCPDKS